jgi:hypothetical protein
MSEMRELIDVLRDGLQSNEYTTNIIEPAGLTDAAFKIAEAMERQATELRNLTEMLAKHFQGLSS